MLTTKAPDGWCFDTNGGTLPHEVSEIVSKVVKVIPGNNLGIHAHNDTDNAVANSCCYSGG